MKNVLAISVCFGSFLGVAAAQSSTLLTVKLPNAAVVGNTNLPAGEYTVRELASTGNSAVLQFCDDKGPKATVVAQEIPAETDRSEVTLKSDGERFEVDKILLAEHDYGFQIAK